MNKWICFAVLILLHTSPAILGLNRVLEITGSENGGTVPVWISDYVEIVARGTLISKWSFNNTIIAEVDPDYPYYNYPNPSLLPNINASTTVFDSFLTLGNVNHIYTGNYQADDDIPRVYLLSMLVYGNDL
jgi:hypothetical protein